MTLRPVMSTGGGRGCGARWSVYSTENRLSSFLSKVGSFMPAVFYFHVHNTAGHPVGCIAE